jgi:MFS family permease
VNGSSTTMDPAGGTAGVFLGGVITEWITWPWVFYLNLPIALVVLALVPGVMPAVAARRGSIDLVGALTINAIIDAGWPSRQRGAISASASAGAWMPATRLKAPVSSCSETSPTTSAICSSR